MGTETLQGLPQLRLLRPPVVKLNNPLMGTETTLSLRLSTTLTISMS